MIKWICNFMSLYAFMTYLLRHGAELEVSHYRGFTIKLRYTTLHTQQDSSRRVISPSQRPLPEREHNTHNRHPCLRCDSNPQSQQTSGRGPKYWTKQPLGLLIQGRILSVKRCTEYRSLSGLKGPIVCHKQLV
jgi:hypothetical protein